MNLTRHILSALAAIAVVFSIADASALDPSTADNVTNVTLQVPANESIEEATAYVGLRDCQTMIDNESKVEGVFQTVFNPQSSEENLFRDAWFFDVERDATGRIDCSGQDLCTEITDEDLNFGTDSITTSVPFRELVDFEDSAECSGLDREYFVRVTVREEFNSDVDEDADGRIIVDSVRPSSPSGLIVTTTENTLRADFEPAPEEDIKHYMAFWSSEPFDGGAAPEDLDLNRGVIAQEDETTGDVTVDLEAGQTLYVAVAAEDLAGNFSFLSGVIETQVVATRDFFEAYKSEGGAEAGGCATVSADAALPMLLVFAALVAIRRKGHRA